MIEPAATAIAARGPHNLDHFARAAAGRDDIFDHDGSLAGRERKTAPQRHLPVSIPLGEKKTHAQRAGYLMSDDQSAESGGNNET